MIHVPASLHDSDRDSGIVVLKLTAALNVSTRLPRLVARQLTVVVCARDGPVRPSNQRASDDGVCGKVDDRQVLDAISMKFFSNGWMLLTYSPARMVPGHEVDVEGDKVPDRVVVDIVRVVLVLVPAAQVCVAVVGAVVLCQCVLDRASLVCGTKSAVFLSVELMAGLTFLERSRDCSAA